VRTPGTNARRTANTEMRPIQCVGDYGGQDKRNCVWYDEAERNERAEGGVQLVSAESVQVLLQTALADPVGITQERQEDPALWGRRGVQPVPHALIEPLVE